MEADTLEQVIEGLHAQPDCILLDNMSTPELIEAVECRNRIYSSCFLEASGGITLERIPEIADIGLDFISVGAITHSVSAVDIGMDFHQTESYP